MLDVASWALLAALIAALFAWRRATTMVSLAMPDRLRIDLHRGRVVAVGAAFAERMGYSSASACKRQFLSNAHFKNVSLNQLVANQVPLDSVTIQDLDGRPIASRLWFGIHRQGQVLELSARERFDFRQSSLSSSSSSSSDQGESEVQRKDAGLSQSETLKQAFDTRQTVEKLAKQIEATLGVASPGSLFCLINQRTGSIWLPQRLLRALSIPLNSMWIPYHRWQTFVMSEADGNAGDKAGGRGLRQSLMTDDALRLSLITMEAERIDVDGWSKRMPCELPDVVRVVVLKRANVDEGDTLGSNELNNTTSDAPGEAIKAAAVPTNQSRSITGVSSSSLWKGNAGFSRASLDWATAKKASEHFLKSVSSLDVLIVDDDPAIASVIAERFESRGVSVRVAHTLEEASDLWAEHTPSIVVIDGWFGDITSEAWIAEKSASEPDVQWVICTADPKVRPAAARWVIEKPFNRSDLDECAAEVMTTCALRAIELNQQTQ
ncbi:MAG: response regulator [Gammaproteobacteria bacterium]|nr:response regulator [Gammaproteobacteria bacterium]